MMKLARVTIALDCLEWGERTPEGRKTNFPRNYVSHRLHDVLTSIAGKGFEGLWWTEMEAEIYLRQSMGVNWTWFPSGSYDYDLFSSSNRLKSMTILFKDPHAALLFKLSWSPGS